MREIERENERTAAKLVAISQDSSRVSLASRNQSADFLSSGIQWSACWVRLVAQLVMYTRGGGGREKMRGKFATEKRRRLIRF